jgi:hypothetical protein
MLRNFLFKPGPSLEARPMSFKNPENQFFGADTTTRAGRNSLPFKV